MASIEVHCTILQKILIPGVTVCYPSDLNFFKLSLFIYSISNLLGCNIFNSAEKKLLCSDYEKVSIIYGIVMMDRYWKTYSYKI